MQEDARSVLIWKERLALSLPPPLLTELFMTVRLPRALDNTSAVWALEAKPPKMVPAKSAGLGRV